MFLSGLYQVFIIYPARLMGYTCFISRNERRKQTKETKMDAKYLSTAAKKVCKAHGLTPRQFERLNSNRPATADSPEHPEYPVLRIWNARREIVITNHDLAYAATYL